MQSLSILIVVRRMSHLDCTLEVDEGSARAALGLSARGLGASIASEVALGFGASSGLLARPCALGGRASGSAVRNRRSANSLALGRHADVLAQRATRSLAVLTRATDFTSGLLTSDVALGGGELLASHLAHGLLALGFALSRAAWVVAFPLAIGEARWRLLSLQEGHI